MSLTGASDVGRHARAISIAAAEPARLEQQLEETRDALRRTEARMQRVLESISDGFAELDCDWRITYVNREAEAILGALRKTRGAVLGRELWREFPALVGSDFEHAYRRAVAEQITVEFEAFYSPLRAWFSVRACPSGDGLSIYFHDVSRRKQAELRLAAERSILEMIAGGATLEATLDRIALECEAQSVDGMLCSILVLDGTGQRLLHGAAPSLPPAYNDAIHGVPIGPNVGSCGTAAFERRPVWVPDIAIDPRWADFKELAAQHGLHACHSTPVLGADGAVLGTIAMYYREPHRPSSADAQIIELATRLASITIQRKRSEDALRTSAERLRATFEQAGVGIASATDDGFYVEMNGKFCEIVGYGPDELRSMTYRDITHPDDLAMTEAAVAALRAGTTADYAIEKRFVRKDASVVWCRVTATLSKEASGAVRFIRLVEDISERKAVEEALRRSEQFSRSVIESSRDCIKTLSLDGKLTWISERGRLALCLDSAVPVIGTSWIDFWIGPDREKAREALAAAAAGGSGSFVGRYAVQGVDRWWDVAVSPVRDANGRPESLLAVSRDITERFEADAKVKQGAEELRQLANLIPQLAWMAEPDGHIFWFNERWYQYTGTTPAQVEGWRWRSVHDPDHLPAVLEKWRASLATGSPFEMEFPLRGADGVFRWFLTRVNPMRDEGGRVIRWFGTNTDVDAVRRIRQTLEDETRILELLNQTGTALASTLDLQSLLQTITDAATKLSGAQFGAFFYNLVDERGEAYTLYTLSGAPREAFAGFGQPRATPLFGPTFRGEGVIRCHDVLQDPRYGQWEPHRGMPRGHLPVRSYLAVPVIARSGEVLGGLFFGHPQPGVFTERSERLVAGVAAQAAVAVDNARLYQAAQRAAEERKFLLDSERHARTAAEHAAKMKDEFLATLSHELRTPLSAMLGWTQVLRLKQALPEESRKGLDAIERNARVQKQLIEDLLDMSRIASGKVRLDMQAVDVGSVLESALETVRPAAEAKGIRLETAFEAQATVAADPGRLQQVVWNLVTNAIKFTPEGGDVRVALRRRGAVIEITVADTGQGIDPAFLQHVFDRFRQADASSTRKHGGLGLGLAIVKHLVELHGGSIEAASPGLHHGATFTVRLPLLAVHRAEAPRLAGTGQEAALECCDFRVADLSGVTILVVDDQHDARELVTRVLVECNARVVAAAGADEALELVQRERPQVIVSDIGMPDVDGFQLLSRIRALGEARGGLAPAIALTAFARPEDQSHALRAGFAFHVSKPVEPADLVSRIGSLLSR